ncbi:MAG: T9SS type A sorting domain-containing protein, partial [Lentimicrobiaceae bacterium]|nr:T9SS type A sorting domain-containing protein [Lentimicrobiaceae bacterium]
EVKVFFEGVAGDPCPAVTDVTAEVYEANKVKVTWTEPAKALTGYKIYQNDTEKATVDAGVTEWTSDVLNGGTYTFAIAATFDDGCTPVKVPAAPVEIKTCNGKVSNLEVEYDEDCTMATITWDAPGGKNRGNTARGQVSYGGPKYIEFDCENIMSNTTITTTFDCYGGGYLNGNLYSYRNDKDANGNALNCHFQVSNSETGELISTIERTELNGVVVGSVCYDYSSSTMYAVRAGTATTSTLNTVDLETGALTQVATLSGLGAIPLTFAITLEGDMYLIEAASAGNGILYSVALSGACTPIGSGTGYPVNYAQSMAFDYNDPDQTLYWAQIAQPTSGNIVTTWAKVDITTGLATAINTSTGMEISALHFPYEYTPTEYEYNIYRDGLQIGGPTTETIFEDNTFAANEGHVWSVAVSCSNGGDGEWVNLDKESCISIPCSSVTDLEIEFNECASATLTWTAVDGATGYKVVRDGETLTTVTENNYTDEFEIDPAQDYKWEVITVCGAGNEAPAEEITATCVGIKEIERTFSIVPNPATDMITIYSTNNIKTVEVINFLGQTVISQQENKVDVSSLTNGIYFVRVAFENGIGVQKFVKQ